MADQDTRKLIGVIAPNDAVRERYFETLNSTEVRMDNPRPTIKKFNRKQRAEVAFDQGGILVINFQSCNGPEFDLAVLADIDEHFVGPDPGQSKRNFYVMVSRASELLFMFMRRGGREDILRILPTDHNVLRRLER